MSWFDAGALANIAKSALKEAQKTIDKALDIKEETEQNMQADSVWGSFTGSFFVDQNDSLDFSTSKLVVQEEENEDACITHSDSVEILGDSSIEIISTDESTTQQLTDEFVSPLDSPIVVDGKLSSPESVEIIPENQEETSIADDTMSCTSISETTVLDLTQKMLYNESVEAITRAPGRSMHLALIDEKTNIIDIPLLDSSDGSISDKTLVDVQIVEGSSSDTASTTTDVSSNSTYLKKMLADAMAEKSSQSDLVKIGSDHTSCDELETTTSSDIEIISSPNGDSSSTQSRQSPIKKPELSSDDSCDINKLLRRIAEMTDILESRESKLIETNRRNAELQEQNSDLKNQLNCLLQQQQDIDLSQVTEEYTQRLSALEKKFQQALREKDVLKKQLEQAKLDVAARLSKNELESAVADKEEVIRELRQEGEKLSKQQLQHGNIIKKLRAKEKEHEATIKTLREANENLTTETDRLKKSLSAKDRSRTQSDPKTQKTRSRTTENQKPTGRFNPKTFHNQKITGSSQTRATRTDQKLLRTTKQTTPAPKLRRRKKNDAVAKPRSNRAAGFVAQTPRSDRTRKRPPHSETQTRKHRLTQTLRRS
ncbi:unnamed protein product [Ceutorhynchus assimilis]|uniref:Uncharacterized protein n=1 Tax=Ceutorhynchus assimilis TaxID=467358 RepID=A0A9N9MK41_9CUCU|nr:unnamed protein product [Ceutorhynchus assimilis]